MAARKSAAAEKAAVSAAEATESETPATTGEAAENAAVIVSEANPATSDTPETDSGLVAVVVLPKRSLRHEGKTHRQHAKVNVPAGDVERLVKLGFVAPYAEVRAAALAQAGAVVTVNDGVLISRGE